VLLEHLTANGAINDTGPRPQVISSDLRLCKSSIILAKTPTASSLSKDWTTYANADMVSMHPERVSNRVTFHPMVNMIWNQLVWPNHRAGVHHLKSQIKNQTIHFSADIDFLYLVPGIETTRPIFTRYSL
jgi:hypothetical protein